jgi:chlorophyllide a hydrolase
MAIETSIWIYWLVCAIAAIVIISGRKFADQLLSSYLPLEQEKQGYFQTLLLGWVVSLLAAAVYALFTVKIVAGSYHLADLIVFSILNGILEQFMFIFWFLAGCYVGQKLFRSSPICIFACGYASYFLYSGLIHIFFWLRVLPEHDPFTGIVFVLALMSAVWMWLLWRYRALIAIVAMHIVLDFLSIGHLHFL